MVVESELVYVLKVTSQHLKLFNATWATAVILTGVAGLVVAVIPGKCINHYVSLSL